MIQQVAIYIRTTGTSPELTHTLRQTVEDLGATMVMAYLDDGAITGRGKFAAWRSLIARLDTVDKIVVANAGDIPGRKVADLLKVLVVLRDHGVTLHLLDLNAGTMTGEVLDIIAAYRSAKLSAAIRAGQAKAAAAGRRIGRPSVPARIKIQVQDALANGGGIRPTARRYGVSPALVINIKRAMSEASCMSY